MTRPRIALTILAISIALVLAGTIAGSRALERVPERIAVLRIVHAGGVDPPQGAVAHVSYLQVGGIHGVTRPLIESPRSLPTWDLHVPARREGTADVFDVPLVQRSIRDERILAIELGGFWIRFDVDSVTNLRADGDGVVRFASLALEMPDDIAVATEGLRELEIRIDETPVLTTRLTLPELPEPAEDWEGEEPPPPAPVERLESRPEEVPQLLMQPAASVVLGIATVPPDAQCLRALIVQRQSWQQTLGSERGSYEAEVPVLVARDEWDALARADERDSQEGWSPSRPSLALDPVARTLTVTAPRVETTGFFDPALDSLYVAVGCFEPATPRALVGVVALELAR